MSLIIGSINTMYSFQAKNDFFFVEAIDDDLTHLTATLMGPAETPYAGGTFQVLINVPDEYPMLPPKVSDYVLCKCFK